MKTLLILLLIGLASWFAWTYGVSAYVVPATYADCLKTHTNDYARNSLSCSFSPQTPAQRDLCQSKGNVISATGDCFMVYHNQDFQFPKNYDECVQRIGAAADKTCSLHITANGAYDKNLAQTLILECIRKGGADRSKFLNDAGCDMTFRK